MNPVVWSERYATRHAGIDDQHRVLFKLLDAVRTGLDSPHHGSCRQVVLDLPDCADLDGALLAA